MPWRPKLAWVLYFIIFQFFDDVQDRHYESAMIDRRPIDRPVYVDQSAAGRPVDVDWLSRRTGNVLVQSVESIRQNGFDYERSILYYTGLPTGRPVIRLARSLSIDSQVIVGSYISRIFL
jgi:hypothetical protein